MSQTDKLVKKLLKDKFVSNYWAIEHYILRLGARILDLKKKGWSFKTSYGKGKEKKNYYYEVISKP